MPLEIIRHDITQITCDAIVNPSNPRLFPSGGVDAAIHMAAGPKLLDACRKLGGVDIGRAVITPGFDLPARHVIHTAGPIWQGGDCGEARLLTSCYRDCLQLAKEKGLQSIAFPLISSGTYGFPKDRVLRIALQTISTFLFSSDMMVYLVVFDKESYSLGEKLFSGITSYIDDHYTDPFLHFSRCEDSIIMAEPNAAPMMQPSPKKRSTAKARLSDAIKLDESFPVKLLRLIDARGMDEVVCYKKANVSKQTWYKIMNDKHYKPHRKTVISFAFALELSLPEAQKLLASVGFTLSESSLFDVIIRYCMENGIYDVFEIDSILFQYDQETLFSRL
ncbi:MAG: macro domain-containing protein [Clostridia bacterium]|nr:macro domain-containing protein [Clostridia bacterium]